MISEYVRSFQKMCTDTTQKYELKGRKNELEINRKWQKNNRNRKLNYDKCDDSSKGSCYSLKWHQMAALGYVLAFTELLWLVCIMLPACNASSMRASWMCWHHWNIMLFFTKGMQLKEWQWLWWTALRTTAHCARLQEVWWKPGHTLQQMKSILCREKCGTLQQKHKSRSLIDMPAVSSAVKKKKTA